KPGFCGATSAGRQGGRDRKRKTHDMASAPFHSRLATGVEGLDNLLGGGLLPGTLTVVAGATGIGKTQLGLQFARAGQGQEGRCGIIFDMTCRGDSQSHADYARRIFGWELARADATRADAMAKLEA